MELRGTLECSEALKFYTTGDNDRFGRNRGNLQTEQTSRPGRVNQP